jgi:D-3-phosphoglycerate dehydrogenase
MRILCTAPYFRPVPERYAALFQNHGIDCDNPFVAQNLSEAELLEIIERYDGVIAGDDEFTARVIEKGARSRLKVIAKWGVGINAIDTAAAEKHGVAVRRSPGILSDAVADEAWGYILMLARHLHLSDQRVRAGEWVKLSGLGLRGRTLGIIGVGDIGKQVALRALPFGMSLLGNDIRPIDRAFLDRSGTQMVSKDELLRRADFVVLACDLNPTSFHLLSGAEFALFKSSAYLVNIARGAVVDTPALVEALREKLLAGAALDVYEEEPLPAESPLRAFENVLLNAHNAFNADTAVAAVSENTVRELLRVLKPEALPDLEAGGSAG